MSAPPSHDWQDRIPLWGWDLLTAAGLALIVLAYLGRRLGWWT